MLNPNINKNALRWTPPGKRPRGRPKMTWKKTMEHEFKMIWGEAETKAKPRTEWGYLVLTLCSDRGKEDA
jgi:hypothetical protein